MKPIYKIQWKGDKTKYLGSQKEFKYENKKRIECPVK